MNRPPWRFALVAGLGAAAALAVQVASMPRSSVQETASNVAVRADAFPDRETEIRVRFDQALVMLHAKRFDNAATALQRVLHLAPRLPEAHVNLGFALLGVQDFDGAGRHFETAVDLRPTQANAYYGLALAAEGRRDLSTAIGAMRAFLHLSHADHPHRSRARAAVWEWEATLGGSTPR